MHFLARQSSINAQATLQGADRGEHRVSHAQHRSGEHQATRDVCAHESGGRGCDSQSPRQSTALQPPHLQDFREQHQPARLDVLATQVRSLREIRRIFSEDGGAVSALPQPERKLRASLLRCGKAETSDHGNWYASRRRHADTCPIPQGRLISHPRTPPSHKRKKTLFY